ncbi:MAG: DUF4304 domain-containing protein [Saprospiraceae bacterium]
MFDSKKYFNKSLTKFIGKPLKEFGFSKFKSNNYVRLTEGNILQCINFQKSRYGGNSFYINISNIPLILKHNSFFGEGGDRIGIFENFQNEFNYDLRVLGDLCLEEIREVLINKVLPWFNLTSSVEGILQFNSNLFKNGTKRKEYEFFIDWRRDKLGYLLLANEEYVEARKLFSGLQLRKFIPEKKEYEYYRDTRYDILIKLLDDGKFEEVQKLLDTNIRDNFFTLKIEKLKRVKTNIQTLKEVERLLVNKASFPFPKGKGGHFYYYQIFSKSNQSNKLFNKLEDLVNFGINNSIRISDSRILIQNTEEYCFHLVNNSAEYIEEEKMDLINSYKGDKDLSFLKEIKYIIEFWGDDDSEHVKYINEHLFILSKIEKEADVIIYSPSSKIFFDEI